MDRASASSPVSPTTDERTAHGRGRAPPHQLKVISFMELALRPGLSFCIASDRAIFLDLPRNRYFCLSPRANDAFVSLVDGTAPPASADLIRNILPANLLAPPLAEGRPLRTQAPLALSDSLIEQSSGRPSMMTMSQALLQLAVTAASLKILPLARIVAAIEREKQAARHLASAVISPALTDIVAAYERANLHVARHDRCLPRSIAMARHLLRAGIIPTLVLAVMVRPFQAHCWVQFEDHVLNDHLDNVRNFTPILIV